MVGREEASQQTLHEWSQREGVGPIRGQHRLEILIPPPEDPRGPFTGQILHNLRHAGLAQVGTPCSRRRQGGQVGARRIWLGGKGPGGALLGLGSGPRRGVPPRTGRRAGSNHGRVGGVGAGRSWQGRRRCLEAPPWLGWLEEARGTAPRTGRGVRGAEAARRA